MVVALAGCTGTPSKAASGSADEGGGSRDSALPAGLLTISQDGDPELMVFATDTERLLERRSIDTQESYHRLITRASISADGRYLVWTSTCEVGAARYNGRGGYDPIAAWGQPGSVPESTTCLDRPVFDPSGTRVRLLAGVLDYRDDVSEPTVVMAIDVAAPAEPPKATPDPVPSRRRSSIEVVGAASQGVLRTFGARIESIGIKITSGAGDDQDAGYDCQPAGTGTIVLCTYDHARPWEPFTAPFGSLALGTVNQLAGTMSLRQIAPSGLGGVDGAVLSPDQSTVLFKTRAGWYTTHSDGSGEPRLVFEGLADPGPMDIDGNVLAVHMEWIAG